MIVGVSGEDPRLLARDSCVALNKDGRLPAGSLNTDRGRGDVEQKEVSGLLRCVATEDSGLDSSTESNGLLVGVD